MKKNKIAVIAKHHPILLEKLNAQGFEAFYIDSEELLQDELLKQELYGIIVSNKLPIDRAMIDLFPSLKVIGRLGSGMEIIDVPYAASRGIICLSSPEGNANAVAEHALGMLLSLMHNIHNAQRSMEQGEYLRDEHTGIEFATLQVGVVGYGNNGKAFAHKLAALGVTVLAYDILPKEEKEYKNIKIVDSIEDILQNCNCISLHIPLNHTTKHLVDIEFFEKMKNGSVLINCARGGIVDTQAMIAALNQGKLIGACIDVWEYEPIQNFPKELYNSLLQLIQSTKLIATPHIAGYSQQATYKMSAVLAEKIISNMK